MWAGESHIDDVARALGREPMEYRRQIVMPKGYVDGFSKNENYYDTFREVMDKGMAVSHPWPISVSPVCTWTDPS